MSLADGKQAINDILTSPNRDIDRLLGAAQARARSMPAASRLPTGHLFGSVECATAYGEDHVEIQTWCLGVLLAEYTAGLLAQKATEGHCNKHRLAPELKACPTMEREHLRMLQAFRSELQGLVSEIDAQVRSLLSRQPGTRDERP